jgi:ribosome biogenesis GTPase
MQNKINLLDQYGLINYQNFKPISDTKNLARIIFVAKNSYKALTNDGIVVCFVKGSNIHYKFNSDSELPKVGDFVFLQNNTDNININNHYFIKQILPRKNTLKRKIAGEQQKEQIIATNIDYAFITISLDEQFNVIKAKRILISVLDSNIKPVFILTKSDLTSDIEAKKIEVSDYFKDIIDNLEIIATSIIDPITIKPIYKFLYNKDQNLINTGVFIGSSGSGKSSIINILLNSNIQKTADVSNLEQKGRHTTTSREMFLLPPQEGNIYGGIIIDTPGMREFGLFLDDNNAIDQGFKQISELSLKCKFHNCSHTNEPHCAVQDAILNNLLNQEQLNEYRKLKHQNEEFESKLLENKLKDKKYKYQKEQQKYNIKHIKKNID